MKRVGKYLKQQRVKAGLTQKQVANAAGYTTPQFVSNIERGLVPPSPGYISIFASIAKADVIPIINKLIAVQKEQLIDEVGKALSRSDA